MDWLESIGGSFWNGSNTMSNISSSTSDDLEPCWKGSVHVGGPLSISGVRMLNESVPLVPLPLEPRWYEGVGLSGGSWKAEEQDKRPSTDFLASFAMYF